MFALKALATGLTLVATVASAVFVAAHMKNSTAPLQPSVLTSSAAVGGLVVVGPSVRPATASPIASTYAS